MYQVLTNLGMEKIILTTPEELSALIDERFRIAFKHYVPQSKPRQSDDTPGEAGQTYVSKRGAARILDCSTSSVDNAARRGDLTRFYFGKSVKFDRQQVLGLAKRNLSHKQKKSSDE